MKTLSEIVIPQESVNDEYVTILEINHNNGDYVRKGEILFSYENSKSTYSIESDTDGYIVYSCSVSQEIEVGGLVLKIFDEKENDKISINEHDDKSQMIKSDVIITKSAKKLIEENNIDKSMFDGNDFVTEDDVKRFLKANNDGCTVEESITNNYSNDEYELLDINANKTREIRYLLSGQEILNSSVFITIDATDVFTSINKYLSYLKNSILPVTIFEVHKLLNEYKNFNGFYNNGKVAYYRKVNIGLAFDIGKGLKVLTLNNDNINSIKNIEDEILNLSDLYLSDNIPQERLVNSTFTITDLSSDDVDFFLPLINKNQSSILGISKNDKNKDIYKIGLTFDHRLSNGKEASKFLNELKERIMSYAYTLKTKEDIDLLKDNIECSVCFMKLDEDEKINGKGFLKLTNHKGIENYICVRCLKGWS